MEPYRLQKTVEARQAWEIDYQRLKNQFNSTITKAIENDVNFELYNDKKDIGFGKPYAKLNVNEAARMNKILEAAEYMLFISLITDIIKENPCYFARMGFLIAFSHPIPTIGGLGIALPSFLFEQAMFMMSTIKDQDPNDVIRQCKDALADGGITGV
jgi:hypothetical protein